MSQIIDHKLFAAIDKLNEQQKEEVLIFVARFLKSDEQYDKWQDVTFVSEMDSRYNYYKNGGNMVTSQEANRIIKDLLDSK